MPAVALCAAVPLSPRCWVALATLVCSGFVQAQEATELAPQMELATGFPLPLPQSGAGIGSRITLTGWSGVAPMAGIGVGLGVDIPGQGVTGDRRTAAPGLDLGLHWRSSDQGGVRVGISQQWKPWSSPLGMDGPTGRTFQYNTRLEMQFSAASARGIQFELGGALGLQLNNNEKLVLRVSRGRPMVYYRLKF